MLQLQMGVEVDKNQKLHLNANNMTEYHEYIQSEIPSIKPI